MPFHIILRTLGNRKILRVNFDEIDIYLNFSPEKPCDNNEYGDDNNRNKNLYDDPDDIFPARIVLIPFIKRSSNRFENSQINDEANVQNKPKDS